MKWVLVLCVAWVAGVAWGAEKVEPIAPKKPIEVIVPIANVAGVSKKIDVALIATVNREEITYRIRFGSDRWTNLKVTDAKPLATALEKAADRMKVGEESTVGEVQVSVGQFKVGGKYVSVRDKESFVGGEMLESDGASDLAQSLLKADGIVAWLHPRLAAMQKRD